MRQANITSKDIKESERYEPEKCPVSSALRRIFHCTVQVHRSFIVLVNNNNIEVYKVSKSLRDWIINYDLGHNIESVGLNINDDKKLVYLKGEVL